MLKKTYLLLFALLVASAPSFGRTPDETDRGRDGLQGPVRRVRTETAKLVYKGGKLAEGERATLETATYDQKGAKVDNAYFLAAGGSPLTGKEVYKYDERGNIMEMTLHNSDGSVMSKEKYDYEFDAMGNWTKMTTSIALIENGQLRFEPTEVTYRFISYFMDDRVAQKLQPASASAAVAAPPATVAPPAATVVPPAANKAAANNAPAASVAKQGAATPAPAKPKQSAAAATRHLPPALAAPAQMSASLVMPDKSPAAAPSAVAGSPVVRTEDDLPPVRKAPVRPISGGVLNGKALSLPKPEYPEPAKRVRAFGTVVVEVVIDVNGHVISAKAVSGPAVLREAAERAAKQARFTPALLTGLPVKVLGQINYNFSL